MEKVIQDKIDYLERIENALMASLEELLDARDGETGGHLRRTARYTEILLNALYERGTFPEDITPDFITRVVRGAVLHDIGKIGIGDATLTKTTHLSEQEMEYMRTHAVLGGKALDKAVRMVGQDSFLNDARDLAYYHHEKWNGHGYPLGLSGEDIPLSARILAVADVYDALTSKRSYKEAMPHEEAAELILSESGASFDPRIIYVFREISDQFREEKDRQSQR